MRAVFATALVLAAHAAAADERSPFFLAGTPVEAPAGIDLGAPMTATLVLAPGGEERLGSLREWFPDVRASDGVVVLPVPAPTSPAAVSPEHRAASFVIDFDEPALAPVRAELAKVGGQAAPIAELERLVDRWIVRKNLSRLFDVASVVAARREGDCSEHAVLLAAVARLAGRPSRVVLGLAVLKGPSGPVALGHAWTEIHEGGAWRVADAAAHDFARGVRYLPLAVLRDEGPGYGSEVWTRLSPLYLQAVRLAPAPPKLAR
jgi:transglutaminase-like putative cysteine protease